MRNGQPLAVMPLDASEFGQGGELLGRALQTDPLWTAVIGDAERRPEMLVRMFTALIRTTVVAKGVAEKTPGMEGVALWLPPGRDMGQWAMLRAGFAMPRFVMGLPSSDRKRMMAVLRQVDERWAALMSRPDSSAGVGVSSSGGWSGVVAAPVVVD